MKCWHILLRAAVKGRNWNFLNAWCKISLTSSMRNIVWHGVCATVNMVPCVWCWNTLHFPGFSLFLFGNLFHVFIINVVLTHKAINSSIQQVNSWEDTNTKRKKVKQNEKRAHLNAGSQMSVWTTNCFIFYSFQVTLPWHCRVLYAAISSIW